MAKRKRDQLGHRVLQRLLELRGPEGMPDRMTQAEIGRAARLSQQDISLVFGQNRPIIPLDILHAVAGVFGQTLPALIEAETFTPLGRASARRAQLQRWVAHADEAALETVLNVIVTTIGTRENGPADEEPPAPPGGESGKRAKRGTRSK